MLIRDKLSFVFKLDFNFFFQRAFDVNMVFGHNDINVMVNRVLVTKFGQNQSRHVRDISKRNVDRKEKKSIRCTGRRNRVKKSSIKNYVFGLPKGYLND